MQKKKLMICPKNNRRKAIIDRQSKEKEMADDRTYIEAWKRIT